MSRNKGKKIITEKLKYSGIYTFVYGAMGAMMPMVGKYFESIGFSGSEIGLITACGTAVSIIAVTFWSKRYTKTKRHNLLLTLLCLGAGLACLATGATGAIGWIIPLYSLMYFFHSPMPSLTDSSCLEAGEDFGNCRKWGCIGYSLGVLLSSVLADTVSMKMIFPVFFGSYILAAVFARSLKNKSATYNVIEEKETAKSEKEPPSYRALLKNRKLVCLAISVFFYGGTNVANNTYFSFMYTEAGGTLAGVGICMFFMILSETPFMAFASRLSGKFGIEKIVLAGMAVSSLRFLWYAMLPPHILITVLFFLPGFVNGILLVEILRYIRNILPGDMVSLGISVYYIFSSNVSTVVCQYAGGKILDIYGGSGVYMFFGIFNLAGIIIYVLSGLHKPLDNIGNKQEP